MSTFIFSIFITDHWLAVSDEVMMWSVHENEVLTGAACLPVAPPASRKKVLFTIWESNESTWFYLKAQPVLCLDF